MRRRQGTPSRVLGRVGVDTSGGTSRWGLLLLEAGSVTRYPLPSSLGMGSENGRGEVKEVGLACAPIPFPIPAPRVLEGGRRRDGGSAPSPSITKSSPLTRRWKWCEIG